MGKIIEHRGVVTAINEKWVSVLIEQKSACAGCHAKSACSVSDIAQKIIEAPYSGTNLSVGDEVILQGALSLGWQAVLLAFVYPFLLLMAVLIFLQLFSGNELLAGVSALAVLIPYYTMLYLCKERLRRKFVFTIKL